MSQSPEPARRRDVQGLRAVAVLGVLAFHAGVPGVTGGFVGVDVFFVISGFLITGNLLRDRATHGRVRLGHFFRNRVARLAPAATATVAATVLVAFLVAPPLDRIGIRVQAIAALVGAENLQLARTGTDYLADHVAGPFQQFWSLGVEEQFYLGWALALAGILAVPALRRRLLVLTAALCTVSVVAMVAQTSASGPWAFFAPHSRAWELGGGAVAAVVLARARRRAAVPAHVLWRWSGLLGIGLVAVSFVVFDGSTPFPGPLTLVPVVGALLLVVPGPADDPVRQLLSTRPMRWIGDRSYSLYLWHWPALVLAATAVGRPLTPLETAAALAAAVVLAWAGHAVFEVRVSAWARRTRTRPVVLVAVVAAVAVAVVPATALPVLHTTTVAPTASAARVLGGPWAPPAVPRNLTPSLASATDDVPSLYASGCHADFDAVTTRACRTGAGARTMVLFGDSHAAQWASPLTTVADRQHAALVTMTKSSCPSVDLTVSSVELGRTYRECDLWRRDALRRITAMRPDVVGWGHALEHTIHDLRASGAAVVLVGDTPFWDETPDRCLSAALHDVGRCAAPRDTLVDTARTTAQAEVAARTGVTWIDPLPWICRDVCAPVLWNVLVYRDANHLTDTTARALEPRLADALAPVLGPARPAGP
ncbi:acyltransferase family protein [Microbacterium sp. M1A1_1b]